ncbi:glycosyltransferase family 39 protein [Pseudovibrio sp. SPO723]|uniref:ArnT family glycosyltransferase n=1 Tax=Nesiotobacter zosterae TaxID=392721 RepID=UPI0029C1AF06|nr:glycosyltransferase family 39 protein [Pseudovibrio sp. SPO723]MDX5592635.1 glycosyltransferase family 39 protein [Pseudovibrio sp. SPO723]
MIGAKTQEAAPHLGCGDEVHKVPRSLRVVGARAFAPLVLLLLCLAVFLPGQMSVPPLDRDEPRFTQATKQMVQSGDYVNIKFLDERRNKKPVGIYWLQAGMTKLTGYGAEAPIWVYRLVSVLGATLAVLFTYWACMAFMSSPAAFTSAAFVALTFILTTESRLAKTDAMLLATVVLAQGALARIWLARTKDTFSRWVYPLVFWMALGAGTLIKGPIILMVSGFTVAGLCLFKREVAWLRHLRPILGLLLLLAIVLPWLVAIYIATDGGFFADSIGRDMLGKVATGQESHGAPPLTHLAASLVLFWPLSAFLLLGFPGIWRERKTDAIVFAASWLVPTWIVFELVSTKLPHYTMPALPAVALAVCFVLIHKLELPKRAGLYWAATLLLALVPVLVAVGSVALPIFVNAWPSPPGVIIAVIGALFGLIAAREMKRRHVFNAFWPAAASSIFMLFGFWAFVGPALEPIWLSPRLVTQIEAATSCEKPQVITVGFNEPSYVFLLNSDITLGNASAAAEFLNDDAGDGCRVATVESKYAVQFEDAARHLGVKLEKAGAVSGLNINGGDQLTIGVYVNGG